MSWVLVVGEQDTEGTVPAAVCQPGRDLMGERSRGVSRKKPDLLSYQHLRCPSVSFLFCFTALHHSIWHMSTYLEFGTIQRAELNRCFWTSKVMTNRSFVHSAQAVWQRHIYFQTLNCVEDCVQLVFSHNTVSNGSLRTGLFSFQPLQA